MTRARDLAATAITEIDMWRLTTTIDTNNEIVGDNSSVARVDDASFSKIGTGMAVSGSGIWTFPVTGIYKISMQALIVCAAGDTTILQLEGTANDFTASDALAWAAGGDLDDAKGTFYGSTLFNCTATATHKVRFKVISLASGSEIQKTDGINATTLCFQRMGPAA